VVQLWSVVTGARLSTLTEHAPELISTIALSPDGRFVAAFGGVITIWDRTEP
jgi:hypothetical protein